MMKQRRSLVWVAMAVFVAGAAAWPSTTRQGVDFKVSTHHIPFVVKLTRFWVRDSEYRKLSKEITWGISGTRVRTEAIFDWTREYIRHTPEGFSIIDDHVWNIVVRGYGEQDQMADVFTTLTAYAGMNAFWQSLRLPNEEMSNVVLSFVRLDGQWTVWDVAGGLALADGSERLLSLEELKEASNTRVSTWYGPFLDEALLQVQVPENFRAELQMPGPRLWYELRRLAAGTSRRS